MKIKNTKQTGFFVQWYRQIVYAWQNAFNDMRRHRMAAILTLLVIAISITLPTVCYLLWKNASGAAKQWSPSPNLTVYLSKKLDTVRIDRLRVYIKKQPEVQSLEYRSRKQTLEEFRHWSGFGEALDLLDENPLPAVLIVVPKEVDRNPDALHQLRNKIVALSGVDDVRLDDSWFTRLTALTGLVASVVWALSLLMVVAVSLVIGNSIRLMIFSRRKTILIMQLNGATEGFILRPFLYSGMLHGIISAFLALILTEIFIFRVDSIILDVSSVFGTHFMLRGLSWEEGLFIVLLATILGWISAWLATRKYLQFAAKRA